ncbi:MAG: LytTR family DNA-binding domain-containing protein [Eubacterium sp.]
MIKIYLCDDNEVVLEKYEKMIDSMAKNNGIEIRITTFISGEQLLFQMSENVENVDILYLDILMGRINGIETAKKLREMGCSAEIIFLTTSEEYVFESFDSAPFYYILKEEISYEKFEEIFLKAVSSKNKKEADVFILKNGGIVQKIYLEDICYFEITNRIATLHHIKGDTIEFYQSMEKLEEELAKKGFVRTQRSFMVNLRYVDRIEKNMVHLGKGQMVPVGAKYIKHLKAALSSYLLQAF